MDLVQFITSAFTDKAREIEEVQKMIATITEDYNDNLKLTAQREEAIRQLKSTLSQEEKRTKSMRNSVQRSEEKLSGYSDKEKALHDEFDLLLQQEQHQISIREQKKVEYDMKIEEINNKKRVADEQTAKIFAEHEKKKQELSKKFEYAQKQIFKLRDISVQMKIQAASALDMFLNESTSKFSIQRSKNDQISKRNDVLTENLLEKQATAQKEIKDLQKQLDKKIRTLREQEKEKVEMFEQNRLYCETQIAERTKKLNTYQNTYQSIAEQREGREEVIEQLRIRFEDNQNICEEEINKLREKQRKQKSKIKQGKRIVVEMQQQAAEMQKEIETQKNSACLEDKNLKKLQRKLLRFKNKLDECYKEEKTKTVEAAKNLNNSEEELQEMAQETEKFNSRFKNAREEMVRQYNEEKRVHEKNCGLKECIVQFEELITKAKAMIPAKSKFTALVVQPEINEDISISKEESSNAIKPIEDSTTFDINQISDLTDLSFTDEPKNEKIDSLLYEKEADVLNMKNIVDQLMQEVDTEREILSELKKSPQLQELREKNALLKEQSKELERMNKEIEELNKRKKGPL